MVLQGGYQTGCCGRGWRVVGVHIRYLGNGGLGFRSYSGSLFKSAKSNQTSPQHSAPRLGSVCPHSGLNPWASCRVAHGFTSLRSASVFDGAPQIKSKSAAAW